MAFQSCCPSDNKPVHQSNILCRVFVISYFLVVNVFVFIRHPMLVCICSHYRVNAIYYMLWCCSLFAKLSCRRKVEVVNVAVLLYKYML